MAILAALRPAEACDVLSAVQTTSQFAIAGQSAQLNATGDFTGCGGGTIQYRFLAGATLLRDWSDNPLLAIAPASTTVYAVQARCSTQIDCTASVVADVLVVAADGAATLTIGPQNSLTVSNIGSTGNDGFTLATAGAAGVDLVTNGSLDPAALPDGAFLRVIATNGSESWGVKQLVASGQVQVFFDFSWSISRATEAYCNGVETGSGVTSSGPDIVIASASAGKHEVITTGQDGTRIVRWIKGGT